MDLTIVALYTICDDFLISLGHQDHPQAKMSEVFRHQARHRNANTKPERKFAN